MDRTSNRAGWVLMELNRARHSFVTSIPICRMARNELKDSSDSLSASMRLSWLIDREDEVASNETK
jgi:hypothetical protein